MHRAMKLNNKQPTAIDLFAGAGGFSLAAREAGFKLLAAVEIDKDACLTYSHNFIKNKKNKPKLYQRDILTELTPKQLKEDLKLNAEKLDLLMGGPPCQGFSSHRINSTGVNDPRNQLLLRYFEYVKELRPKVFLVENVAGMLWKRHEDYVTKFKALAKKHGYKLYGPQIINAKDYGVPQNRKRVFILGVDKKHYDGNISWPPNKTHGPGTNQEYTTASTVFEKPSNKKLKELTDILTDEALTKLKNYTELDENQAKVVAKGVVNSLKFLERPFQTDACNQRMNTGEILIERISHIKMNGGREQIPDHLVIDCHKGGYGGHKDVYARIKLTQPSNTITTGCNNLSKGRFTHPWLNTGISIREAASLQTFPRDFVFLSSQTSQAKQVGNAVPPLLGKHLIVVVN